MCQEILNSTHGYVRLQHIDNVGEQWCYDDYEEIPEKCTRPRYKDSKWIEIVICYTTDIYGQTLDLDFMESFRYGSGWKKIYENLCKYKNHIPIFQNASGLEIEMRSKHWRRITS